MDSQKVVTKKPVTPRPPVVDAELMEEKKCKVKVLVEGKEVPCGRTAFSKGMCTMHYQRDRRGTPMKQAAKREGVENLEFKPRLVAEAKEIFEREAKRYKLTNYELGNAMLELPHRLESMLPTLHGYAKLQGCSLVEAIARMAEQGLEVENKKLWADGKPDLMGRTKS